jgi:hypothetical protein
VGNAPSENLPPGCTCVLVAPGAIYEARVFTPTCRVHGTQRGRGRRVRVVRTKRNDY